MIRAVNQLDLDVHHREASEHARADDRLKALLDAGTYSFGTEPPTILDSKEKPAPGSFGSTTILTRANWPEPPDCFLWV